MNQPSQSESVVALVTGASRGIGAAIAQALGQYGHTVIGTATTDQGAQAISQTLQDAGITGQGYVLDVRDPANIQALVKQITNDYASPGILVNNAAVTRDNLAMRMKDEEWDEVIATNLTAVHHMCKAVMRGMMKARNGRIINIGSVVGLTGNAGQVNYSAAKAGVTGLTLSLARELGSRGITVNTVAPGFIDTDMTRELDDDLRASLIEQIPLARLGQPEDIAGVVAFLASPAANYITGQVLSVNGGMYMG